MPEHTIDDAGESINSAAVLGDTVVNLVTDDEDESSNFILGLAVAGVLFCIFGSGTTLLLWSALSALGGSVI